MSDGFDVPASVREFLASRVQSHEELEVLLILQRRCGRPCQIRTIARLTTLSEARVEEAAEGLCQRGLAVASRDRSQVYQYAPPDDDVDALVVCLADAYQNRKFEVIRALTDNALKRLRVRAARRFEAFLERKERST